MAWSPTGGRLAWAEPDGEIVLWDLEHSRREDPPLSGLDTPAYALAFSPDGAQLAASDDDGILRIWDLASPARDVTQIAGAGQVNSVSFSRDGRLLATAGDGQAHIWSTSSWQQVSPVIPGNSIAFSPDDRTVAVGNGHDITLWDVATGQPVGSARTPTDESVQDVVFDAAGTTIATSAVDGRSCCGTWDRCGHGVSR